MLAWYKYSRSAHDPGFHSMIFLTGRMNVYSRILKVSLLSYTQKTVTVHAAYELFICVGYCLKKCLLWWSQCVRVVSCQCCRVWEVTIQKLENSGYCIYCVIFSWQEKVYKDLTCLFLNCWIIYMLSFSGRKYTHWTNDEEREVKDYFNSFILDKESKKLPGQN